LSYKTFNLKFILLTFIFHEKLSLLLKKKKINPNESTQKEGEKRKKMKCHLSIRKTSTN